MPLLVAVLILPLLVLILMPIALIQRARRGAMRRQARLWLTTINAVAVMISTAIFLTGAVISAQWIPAVLPYSLAGLTAGAMLGVLGLALTRWEGGRGPIYYTPNRWLVLAITTVVAARILYGLWRTWAAWRSGTSELAAAAASGVPLSMAAGASVLGYYVIYWLGVRRRVRLGWRTAN
jgi:hypothetical protein